jgi:tetratricopeptide (TPR) repeat protein
MNAPRAIALCQCFNGRLEYVAGHWPEAESALRDSIKLHRELGAASGEALAWQQLGVLQTARGQLDEAMASLEEGVAVAERATMRAHCLTRLYASMTRNRLIAGDIEAADHFLALGLEMGRRHGNCATCDSLLYPAAVSVCIAKDRLSEAESFARQLEKSALKYGSRTWVAMARQTRGELMAAQGDIDGALTHYIEACQAFAAAGNEYEPARCLQAMAALRQARNAPGDLELAGAAESQAQRIFEQLGAALSSG